MTTPECFPLIEEQSLPNPTRGWFRWWRDPATLPDVPPGAVLVFRAGDRFEVVDGDRLGGHEDVLLDATTVGVVDCRSNDVTAEVVITSRGQAIDFTAQVTFSVQVDDAAAVFRQGIKNLRATLTHLLRQDEQLVKFDDQFAIDQLVSARRAICAYVMSAYNQRPPRIDGVRVTFQSVTVAIPPKVRTHAESMQDKVWDLAKEGLDQKAEEVRVVHVANLTRTPEAREILAIARGQLNISEAAQSAYQRREKQIEILLAEVKRMEENGEADRDSVDRQHLVAWLDRLLTGSEPPPAQLPRQTPRSLRAEDEDEPPVFIPE
jgi:hypothetical protein